MGLPRLLQALRAAICGDLNVLAPLPPMQLQVIKVYRTGLARTCGRVRVLLPRVQPYTFRVQLQCTEPAGTNGVACSSTHLDFPARVPFKAVVDVPCRDSVLIRAREVGPGGAGAWGEWVGPLRLSQP